MNKKLLIAGSSVVAAGLSIMVIFAFKPQHTLASASNITSNPVSITKLKRLKPLGVELTDKGKHAPVISSAKTNGTSTATSFISASTAANVLQEEFHGTSTNVRFVIASRHNGNSYESMNPHITKGDPNFVSSGNTFHNIPCYYVTVNGIKGLVSTGPQGSKAIAHTSVSALIDAVTGEPLLIYSAASSAS